MRIIDFHAHAFPDAVAEKAMPLLEEEGHLKAPLEGTVASLLKSMDETGVEISVLASIATKPKQFQSILNWSKEVASDRLTPFPSVHPDDPDLVAHVRTIRDEGFKGVKLHPYYQSFEADDERAFPLYEAIQECGLVLLLHTGFDMAYPRDRIVDPARIVKVIEAFPELRLVTTHLGAWEDWDEVRRLMLGRPILMDVSYSIDFLGAGTREFILSHPADCVIFGTDSPWEHPRKTIDDVRRLDLGEEVEHSIFHRNAERLLGLAGT